MSLKEDIAAFNAKLDSALQQTMGDELVTAAKAAILWSVWDNVYEMYVPTEYKRRYDNGGLYDPDNIELVDFGEVPGGYFIEVGDMARDDWSGRLLYPVIESGEGYEWEFSEIYHTKQPRPFHQEAAKYMKDKGYLDSAIKQGLNRRGFDVI